jgi:hypothetical protein
MSDSPRSGHQTMLPSIILAAAYVEEYLPYHCRQRTTDAALTGVQRTL